MFDIDHFKSVNDTYGHPAGDAVLKEFAQRISRNVRGVDLCCRLGGEEFVVVMPDTDAAFAKVVAERLRVCIANTPFTVDAEGTRLDITVSIGLATTIGGSERPSDLLSRADHYLYEAKRNGRNQVVGQAA